MMILFGLAGGATIQPAVVQDPNYPSISVAPELVRELPSGVEVFRLVVGPSGAVIACSATIKGRGPVKDPANCKKAGQFKAKAAIDQNGQTVLGAANFLVSWQRLGKGQEINAISTPPRPEADLFLPLNRLPIGIPADATSGLALVVGADGKVEACEVQQTSGLKTLDEAACRAITTTGFGPMKDATGTSVRSVQTVRVGFSVPR